MKGSVRTARRIMGRLKKGDDLLAALTRECADAGIELGEVRALGAVSRARVGYYDQVARRYEYVDLDTPLEILALVGNVSLKDGQPFVHAHITLGDREGRAWGGHLAEGTVVFAGEFIIREYLSEERFERRFDEETGLFLWGE
ncbi:MAG: PPC domain-containing DNA-binding protein [Bacillota bacterium]